MCVAIICLILSLGIRASAEAIQCSPTDRTSTCHVSDQSVLLQSRLKISAKVCNPVPCKVRGEAPKGHLQLDIFNQADGKTSPVVLAFHGNGGDVESLHGICEKLVVPAGFACATIDGKNNKIGAEYVEGAIQFLTKEADIYGVDPNNLVFYGYSKGGYNSLAFIEMQSNAKNKLKGVVSDCSSPGNRLDYLKKKSSTDVHFPPYLMIHCDEDKKMKRSWTVDKSEENLEKANANRGPHEQINFQSMRFSKATGCNHQSLVKNSDVGAKAMLSFIQSVFAGTDPFANNNIPKKVTDKNVVSKPPKKKKKKNKKNM